MRSQNKILIVDDNQMNVDVTEEILGDEYQMESAASGEECLEKAADFKPDIILLDIMMPGIDGYETCKRLRANEDLEHTKIIMLSAKAMEEDRIRGYDVGADDYIAKPYNKDELRQKMRVFMSLVTVKTEQKNIKKEGLRTVKDMVATYNHNMNQPLTVIYSYLNILQAQFDKKDKKAETLQKIKKELDKINELLKKIREISTVERENYVGDDSMIDLDASSGKKK